VRSVTVIVPARDAEATLPATVAALDAQDYGGEVEVLVIPDADGEGPAAMRNAGAARAAGEVLAFTDADCVPAPGWLTAAVAEIDAGADLVQGRVEPDPGTQLGAFDRTVWVTGENGLYETANLVITRELFERLGGFESWLGGETGKELGEDTWLGWRARRAGAHVTFASGALVHHAVFERGWREFAAERARLRFFPALAGRVPELRERLFFSRVFLSPRSAAFDAAVLASFLAAVRRSPLPLAGAAPYGVIATLAARRSRPHSPVVLFGDLAADAVGFVALARGSVASRSLLL
jgi:glycosyltransferase involved in cell wall biosynthesis